MKINKIKALCQKQGISMRELEIRTGIGNGTVARWEGHSPGVENLKKVADYFSVTVDELLRDD